MPQIQTLSASAADAEYNRRNGCGGPSAYHQSYCNKKIVARVLKYKAPWGCKRLPMFTVNGWFSTRVFAGQSWREGERLGYDSSPLDMLNDSEEDDDSLV
jgi:hypothetical protein